MIVFQTLFLIYFYIGLSSSHPSVESPSSTIAPNLDVNATGTLNSTTLNVLLSSGQNTSVSLNLVSTSGTTSEAPCHNATSDNSTTTANVTASKLTSTNTSELTGTNIEKPKEIVKRLEKNRSTNQSDEIDLNRTQLTSDELDNNSTILNNSSYSSLGDDILNVNEFNKNNLSPLDLQLDASNSTVDELNSTTIKSI